MCIKRVPSAKNDIQYDMQHGSMYPKKQIMLLWNCSRETLHEVLLREHHETIPWYISLSCPLSLLSLEHWAHNHTHGTKFQCIAKMINANANANVCAYIHQWSQASRLNIIGKSTHGLKDPAVCSHNGGWPGNFMICCDSMWLNLEWNHLASSQLHLIDQHIKIFKQLEKHWQCKFPSRLRHAPAKVLPINRLKTFFPSLFAPFSHVWISSHQSGTSLAAAFPAVNLAWFMIKFHDFQFLCLSLSLFIAMPHSFCLLHLWNLWQWVTRRLLWNCFT